MSVLLTFMDQNVLEPGVMFQQVQDQVQWRADLLLAGRFEDMSREYLYLLPVYLGSRLIPLGCPDEGMRQAAALQRALLRRRVEKLTITVKALELPKDGRFRVWADWHAVSQDGMRSRRLGLVYYMRETRSGYRSEMLQYSAPRRRSIRPLPTPHRQSA